MTKRTWITPIAVVAAGFLLASATMKAAEVADSEQVSKLLSEAKTIAFQLKEDASSMEGYTRSNVSWEAHAEAIRQVREHLKALERQMTKLQEAKKTASPWQKTAIDRMIPFMDELDGYTMAALEHINGERTGSPNHSLIEYKDFLEANADYTADLASMIANFVDYGKTKQRLDRLATKHEIPTER